MQTHPHAHARQRLAQFQHARLDRLAIPEIGLVLDIDAVGAGVLGDHQDLLDAGLDQPLGFAEHIAHRAANQLAAHGRDDAEAAAVVAAFGNLQVGVVTRGELDALRRHQIDEGIVVDVRRHHFVHRIDDLLVLLRTGNGKHAGVHVTDVVFGHAHAAGDDHLAVLGDGFADGIQRFRLGTIDEAAGVDDHHVGVLVGGHDLVTLRTQLGQDAFGIDRCLGAPQRNKPYTRCFTAGGGWCRHRGVLLVGLRKNGARVYSYLRFSDPRQAIGSSADRQLQYAQKWAADRGLLLDESLSLRDEGLSAYHQQHVKQGALGAFLRAVDEGRIPDGSVLIGGGLDRLSPAEPIQAQAQLAQIINAGITVVTASDGREYNRAGLKAQPMDLVYSLLVMIRAHEESDTKSKRVKAAIRRQ